MAGPPPEQPEDNTTPPVPQPPSVLDAEAQFEQALNRDIQQPKLRPSTKFKFPWAAQLDDWLPTALVVVGVLWSIRDTFRSEIGPVWAKLLRLVVILGLYAGVVVPITMIGVRKMAMKLAYALPPMPAWRTAATFVLPAMLGYVTWVALVSPASFAIGCLLGLVFAAGAFWFLFRVDPQKELLPSFGAATGSFVGSLICCGIIMWVLNMVLFGVMKSNHTADTVKISPIGPSFAWNVETPIPQRRPNSTGADSDGSDSEGKPSQPLFAQSPSTASNIPTIKINPNLVANANAPSNQQTGENGPAAVTAASQTFSSSSASPTTAPTTQGVAASSSNSIFEGINEEAATTPRTVTPDPIVKTDDPKFVAELKAQKLPFFKDVRWTQDIDAFDELVYPATTSPFFAVVSHKDPGQDIVELRNGSTFERIATANFPHEPVNTSGGRRYAVSPDGQCIARLAGFPRPMFEVWSCKEQAVASHAYMEDGAAEPLLFGFVDNEHYLTQCRVRGVNHLELRDVRSSRVSLFSRDMPPNRRSPANGQISPDGKLFALTAKVAGRPELVLYDCLHPSTRAKVKPIPGLSEQYPAEPVGIAFTSDSSRVAAMFVNQGAAYIIAWNRDGNPAPISEQTLPGIALTPQDPADPCSGRVFDWLGNNAWLLGGTSILDASTGKLVGELAKSPVKAQHCVGRESLHLVYSTDKVKNHLAVVQLDPTKVAQLGK